MSNLVLRKVVLAACFAVLAFSGCSPAPPSSQVDSGAREVVTFEGGGITEGEVAEGVEKANAASAAATGTPAPEIEPGSPEFEAAKAQVVPQLLTVDLSRAYARENDIRVSEDEVQAEVDTAREQVGQQAAAAGQDPKTAFQDALEQFGYTEESFRGEVRTGLLVQKVQEDTVGDEGPTEEEVRKYYDENKEASFTTPEQRCIRHILFNPDQEQQANDAKGRLADGGEFAALAKEFSQDPGSKDKGGDLGCVPSGQFVPEFEEAAFKARQGEIAGPVKTEFGFHLIEVTEIQPPAETPLEDAAPQIEEQLSQEQQATEFDAWIQAQLKQRNVKYLPGYNPAEAVPPEVPAGAAPPEQAPPEQAPPEQAPPEEAAPEQAPPEQAPPEGEGQYQQ